MLVPSSTSVHTYRDLWKAHVPQTENLEDKHFLEDTEGVMLHVTACSMMLLDEFNRFRSVVGIEFFQGIPMEGFGSLAPRS